MHSRIWIGYSSVDISNLDAVDELVERLDAETLAREYLHLEPLLPATDPRTDHDSHDDETEANEHRDAHLTVDLHHGDWSWSEMNG